MKVAFVFLLLFIPSVFFAQTKPRKDTVYYLIDTLKIPVKDRMISTETALPFKFYTLKCNCLSSNNMPVFRANLSKQNSFDKKQISKIDFISLPKLIELVRKNDDANFDDKFTIYFIEPLGKRFIGYKAFFLGGHTSVMQ
jgi:hypothetical protein